MRKQLLFIFSTLFTSLSAQEAKIDSISLIQDNYYTNPAFIYYRHSKTISAVNIVANAEDRDIYILQEGKGFDGFALNASSWMALKDNNKIWGGVSYRKGKRKDISWSETSDTQLLYPYVMADSVGGDLSGQRYLFNGGYAAKINRVIIGAELSYRAEIEFRDIDPRPRNIISDLMIKGGVSYNLKKHQIGTALSYSSYNQNNDVTFYSKLGKPYVHTMTGLGNKYTRFDGTRTSAEYTGNSVSSSVNIRPINNYGLWANAIYTYDKKSRRLSTENNIPITEMEMNSLSLSAAYMMRIDNDKELSLSVEADMARRKGKENLFNSGNGISMEIIGQREPYNEDRDRLTMQLLYRDRINDRYTLSIKPSATMSNSEMNHEDNDRYMKVSTWHFDAAIENDFRFKKWELVLTANGGYRVNNSSSISLPSLSHKGIEQMLLVNYNVLSSDRTNFALSATAYLPLNGYKLYTKAAWHYEGYNSDFIKTNYTKRDNNRFELNLGILF